MSPSWGLPALGPFTPLQAMQEHVKLLGCAQLPPLSVPQPRALFLFPGLETIEYLCLLPWQPSPGPVLELDAGSHCHWLPASHCRWEQYRRPEARGHSESRDPRYRHEGSRRMVPSACFQPQPRPHQCPLSQGFPLSLGSPLHPTWQGQACQSSWASDNYTMHE